MKKIILLLIAVFTVKNSEAQTTLDSDQSNYAAKFACKIFQDPKGLKDKSITVENAVYDLKKNQITGTILFNSSGKAFCKSVFVYYANTNLLVINKESLGEIGVSFNTTEGGAVYDDGQILNNPSLLNQVTEISFKTWKKKEIKLLIPFTKN